jgi:hypothetical protein
MSHRSELDIKSLCRCRDHTEALIEEATHGILWDEYGIVADLVVSLVHYLSSTVQRFFSAIYK